MHSRDCHKADNAVNLNTFFLRSTNGSGFQEPWKKLQEGFMRFVKTGTVGAEPVAEVNDNDSAALIFLRVSVVSVFQTNDDDASYNIDG